MNKSIKILELLRNCYNKLFFNFTVCAVFSIITLSLGIFAVEERNPLPFYYLQIKPLQLKLKIREYKLCRVKLDNVIQYDNIEILDCNKIEKKILDSIKAIQEKNMKKNELNLMFVDGKKKILNPELHTPIGIYNVKSILYFKKDKTHHIELLDKNGGYYYFTYDPNSITVVE